MESANILLYFFLYIMVKNKNGSLIYAHTNRAKLVAMGDK